MATTLKLENKGKPTPPFWHGVGRALVLAMTPVTAVILLIPIPEPWKTIIAVGAAALLSLGKELTTYTFNPEKVPLSYFPQPEIPLQPATKDVTAAIEKIAEVKANAEEKLIKEVSK